jgi:RNA polymerase sigma-70 factor (ECF subfamily)
MSGDMELVRRTLDNDPSAFEQLVRKYMRHVYATCFAIVKNHFDADDAAQQTFVSAYTKLSTFEGRSAFGTWLIRIAVNHSRSILRRHKTAALVGLPGDPPDPSPDVLSQISARRDVQCLNEAVSRLPEKQRLTVSLRIHQGLPFARISEILDISEGAARTSYHYGMRRIMREFSGTPKKDTGGEGS